MFPELQNTLNLLDRFIGDYPVFMYLTDADDSIVWLNRYFSKEFPEIKTGQPSQCLNILEPCEAVCEGCEKADPVDTPGAFSRTIYSSNKTATPGTSYLEFFSFPVYNREKQNLGTLRVGFDVTQSEEMKDQLRAKEKRYRAIVEGTSDAIIFIDHENLIREWNAGAEEIFGYSTDEIVGQSIEKIMPAELIEMGELTYLNSEVRRRGVLKKYETQRRCKDGKLVYVDISRNEVYDEDGDSIGVSEILKDIHARKDLEFELLRTILELSKLNELNEILYRIHDELDIMRITLIAITAGQGLRFNRAFILLADQENKVLKGHLAIGPSDEDEANRIWTELNHEHHYLRDIVQIYKIDLNGADKKVNEIVGQISVPMDSSPHILLEAMEKRRVIRVKEGKAMGITDPLSMVIDDRSLLELLNSRDFVIVPIFTKKEQLGVIIADNCINNREISGEDVEGLRLFASLAGSALENARLYSTLAERINELQSAYKQLEESQEQLLRAERLAAIGEMSAKVAHEIRNPLVSIGGFARIIERKILDDPKLKQYAGIIREQVENLENILNNLLGTANPRPPEKRTVDVKQLLEQVGHTMSHVIEQKNIALNFAWSPDEQHTILGDPKMLYQALLNLIKNAVDALEARENEAEISLQSQIENGQVVISIADNGPGIPPDQMNKIFEKFFTTKSQGTGLGLSVVQEIVNSHRGTISVESDPQSGTVFRLLFPLNPELSNVLTP